MKKRVVSLMMVLVMVLSLLSGCGAKDDTAKSGSSIGEIDFNESGYPLVNEPITLKVGVLASTSTEGDWDDLEWVKQLEATSGVDLEFVIYNNAEAVNLMFTGGEFPDITWNVGSNQQIYEAAQAGKVYALDEYMEEYAPNWQEYFSNNKDVLGRITFPDGHVYSFPMVREEGYHYQVRDIWQINKTWLDELGLQVPTTTDEFYNALKAIKENAGKGSIPADVVPYYVYGVMSHIGGALDVINSFGVRVSIENKFVTVDEKGKVEFNFANKDIIEPLNYLHKLVAEGLIPKSCFTDDYSTYTAKTMSNEKNVACFHSYYNYSTETNEYVDFGPLDSGNGKQPLMRSQANAVSPNYFTVYKTCKYPELAVRLANMIAEKEWTFQATYGMLDNEDSTLYKDDDGNYVTRAGLNGYDRFLEVPSFRVACLMSDEVFSELKFEETSDRYKRQHTVDTVYKGKTIPQENLFPFIFFSEENITEIEEKYYDISTYVRQTITDWVVNGNIEAEWDGYIKQLETYGLDRYLELLQEELDAYK